MPCDIFTFIRAASELSATALLIMVGCMGDAMNKDNENAHLVVSLHYGLVVMVVMHIFGFVSGAHANPCISISCYFMGYIAPKLLLMYVACQVLGAGVGYLILMLVLPQEVVDRSQPAVCLSQPLHSLSSMQIVGIECLLTSVYMLGWCALWDVRNGRFLDSVSLRMGLLVTACSFAGVGLRTYINENRVFHRSFIQVQLTGASMNPVKTLVPSLFQGNPGLVWMQLTGQVLASIMVPIVWQTVYMPRYQPLEMPI
ncbi:hypothetical protein KR032_005954 [Drosophila birchii]|nr:hypothetical protein KR032_005954 [Drosophila birchii]